ncbi:MAG: M23 family peptidase [Chloroflexi bacterium]|nr:MAG: M23 family peptidase [Chloroflexota bacterium]
MPSWKRRSAGTRGPLLLVLVAVVTAFAAACASGPMARGMTVETPAAGSPAASAAATSPAARPAEATPSPTPSTSPTVVTPSATAPGTTTPARTPGAAAPVTSTQPGAFTVQVDPPFVGRGDTMLVRVTGPTGGTVRVAGRTVPLFSSATGAWAVVGVNLYADFGPATLTVAGRDAQGKDAGTVSATYTVVDPNRPADYLVVTEEVGAILTPEAGAKELQLRAQQFASFDATPRWRTAFRHPILGFEVTTQFGSGRSINGGPIGDFHSGEDLAADAGTPVTVAAPGRVAWAGEMPIRGNSVVVDHGGGVMTGYHHMQDYVVSAGQQIEAGTLIGHVGSTGFSTGPHLHWELTIYGVNVDPETWVNRNFPR